MNGFHLLVIGGRATLENTNSQLKQLRLDQRTTFRMSSEGGSGFLPHIAFTSSMFLGGAGGALATFATHACQVLKLSSYSKKKKK